MGRAGNDSHGLRGGDNLVGAVGGWDGHGFKFRYTPLVLDFGTSGPFCFAKAATLIGQAVSLYNHT